MSYFIICLLARDMNSKFISVQLDHPVALYNPRLGLGLSLAIFTNESLTTYQTFERLIMRSDTCLLIPVKSSHN